MKKARKEGKKKAGKEARKETEKKTGKKSGSSQPLTFYRTFDDEIVRLDPERSGQEPPTSGLRLSYDPIPVIPGFYTLIDAFEKARTRQSRAMTDQDRIQSRLGSPKEPAVKEAGTDEAPGGTPGAGEPKVKRKARTLSVRPKPAESNRDILTMDHLMEEVASTESSLPVSTAQMEEERLQTLDLLDQTLDFVLPESPDRKKPKSKDRKKPKSKDSMRSNSKDPMKPHSKDQ